MANNIAFQPMGKTYKCNATTTTQTIQVTSDSPVNQYMIASHEPTGGSGQPVYVKITASTSSISLPTNGSPQYCLVVPPDTVMVVTGPQVSPTANVYVSFISEADSPECYITPGEGL